MPRLKPAPPVAPPPVTPPIVSLADKAALTVEETADVISLGQTMTRQLIASGRIKAVRVGRAILVPRTEIEAFLTREASAPITAAPRDVQLLRVLADARQLTAAANQVNENLRGLMG